MSLYEQEVLWMPITGEVFKTVSLRWWLQGYLFQLNGEKKKKS